MRKSTRDTAPGWVRHAFQGAAYGVPRNTVVSYDAEGTHGAEYIIASLFNAITQKGVCHDWHTPSTNNLIFLSLTNFYEFKNLYFLS